MVLVLWAVQLKEIFLVLSMLTLYSHNHSQ